jgi:hypothetical protein
MKTNQRSIEATASGHTECNELESGELIELDAFALAQVGGGTSTGTPLPPGGTRV